MTTTRFIEIVPRGGSPFLVDGISFWLIKSRGRPPFGWWNLEADHIWSINSRGGPPLGSYILMNSRGGPPCGGLYIDEFWRMILFWGAVCWWLLEADTLFGAACWWTRDNYGSSGISFNAGWSGLGINWVVYGSYCYSGISFKPDRTRLLSWYINCTRYAKTWCWTLWQCDVRHGAVISRVSSQPRTPIWHRFVALSYFHILRHDFKNQAMLKYWRRSAV